MPNTKLLGFGSFGSRNSLKPHSFKVMSAFILLHGRQQATILVKVVGVPCFTFHFERGTTWSYSKSVSSHGLPQYWQVNWSRIKTFLRENGTVFFLCLT